MESETNSIEAGHLKKYYIFFQMLFIVFFLIYFVVLFYTLELFEQCA